MSTWIVPALLDRPPPRPVRMKGVFKWVLVGILGMGGLLPIILAVAIVGGGQHKTHMFLTRGADIIGTVTRLSLDASSHTYHVGYSYMPKEFADRPYSRVEGEDSTFGWEYYALKIGGNVGIVYDPMNADQSALKSDVESSRGHDSVWPLLLVLLPIFIFIPSIVVGVLSLPYFRERSLLRWGKAVEATIIGEVEYGPSSAKLCTLA